VFEVVIMVADERSLLEMTDRVELRLAMIDLALARPDGLGFLRELRRAHPALRIIVLSDHPEPSVTRSTLEAGADACVLKRLLGTDLLPAIEAVLAGKPFVSTVPSQQGEESSPASSTSSSSTLGGT
jgi:DNA-binding NarL/FixJ family response regulator